MGKRGPPLSKKAEYAAFILKDEPALGIRNAMVRAGYTKEESANDNRQRHVRDIRRRLEAKEKASQPPDEFPLPPAVTPSSPKAAATHASIQTGSTNNNPLVIESPPKKKRKRTKGYNLSFVRREAAVEEVGPHLTTDDASSEIIVELVQQDAITCTLVLLQERNHECVKLLNEHGWNGDAFKMNAPVKNATRRSTTAALTTREEKIINLSKSSMGHGSMFYHLGGAALNCDDIFIARERANRIENKKIRDKEIKQLEAAFQRQEQAKIVLAKNKTVPQLNGNELSILLRWKMEGKGLSKLKGKEDKVGKWNRIKDKEVPDIEDPAPVRQAFNDDVIAEDYIPSIEETELYRQKARDKLDIRSKLMGDSYSLEEMKEMMQEIMEKKQASAPVVNALDEID